MPRKGRAHLTENVFECALERIRTLYRDGHRLVVSFSAGKDSGICLELCRLAANLEGAGPVDVIMRDEEIMFPGTFEYALEVAQRPDVNFHWIYACQPVTNVYNRIDPYFWVFDPLLPPGEWVRQPPDIAYQIDEKNIEGMTIPDRFPVAKGKELMAVIGLRTSESRARMYGLFNSGGYITKANRYGVRNVRPIYDWGDADVWKAYKDEGWPYNPAYDVMYKMGVSKNSLRIAPPTLNTHGVESLAMASKAWPGWFDRVARRLPGVRLAVHYGLRAIQPMRKDGETWKEVFYRECIDDAPADWIRERAETYSKQILRAHAHHSTGDIPEVVPCRSCSRNNGSWRALAYNLYNGDPSH